MSKKRTYSDDIRPSSSNSRKSSNGSIEINLDAIAYRDSRSYSIDSRSYSIDSISYNVDSKPYTRDSRTYSRESRSCSIDSNSGSSIAGSFEEKKTLTREIQDYSPLFEMILNSEKKTENFIKRRDRKYYLKKSLLDEPKTTEEVKKYLSIFKKQ